jgi:hypothetical protein
MVHPAAPSFVAAAATTAGASARSQEASKRAHYARRGLWGGYKLVPVSVESFERLGAPAYALLRRVADVAAGGDGVSKAAFIESALQEMGVTLAKGNGRMLRAPFASRTRQWPRVPERVASAGG